MPFAILILPRQIQGEIKMTKVKHKTNVQLINGLMTHSQQGVLMQAFIIEAISHYAEQTKVSPPWSNQSFISEAAWRACADEALDAINNRSK
jgi:hypothetical protein